MHRLRLAFACLVAASSALMTMSVACSGEGAADGYRDGDAIAPAPVPQDARFGGSEPPTLATMRVAHLAPALGSLDFCYQAARIGSFEGPVFRGPSPPSADAGSDASDDGGAIADAALLDDASAEAGTPTTPLGFRSVSKYFTLNAAGTLKIAIVEAGATSCAAPIATGDVTLDPGKLSTVALLGSKDVDGGAVLSIVAFTDDRTTVDDKARVRVVHAALGGGAIPAAPAIAVRAVAAQTTVLADHVAQRAASSPSQAVPVDGLGYATVSQIPPPASLVIGPATTDGGVDAGFPTWQSESLDLGLRGGSLHTAFVVRGANAGFEVVWCADKTTTGDRTTCDVLR